MTTDGRTTGETLLALLPAIHRIRDEELAGRLPDQLTAGERTELLALEALGGAADEKDTLRREELRAKLRRGPLGAFLALVGDQVAVLEESLDQLYDDLFLETAAPWVLPYLGDLIGYRLLHPAESGETAVWDRRAEIGHTIAFRRRKGTASMLEQLARDVTGHPGAAVAEMFTRLATTQSLDHLRPTAAVTPSLRDGAAIDRIGTAFGTGARTLDVRAVEAGAARPAISNIAAFVWRLHALRTERTPAVADVSVTAGVPGFRFHPLGIDCQLVQRPEREEEISHLAEPRNVPGAITRRRLLDDLPRLYGPERSLAIWLDGVPVPATDVVALNLADSGSGWMRTPPAGKVGIDPELGRLAVAGTVTVTVMFHRAGVSGAFGGEYARAHTFGSTGPTMLRVPQDHPTVQAALNALAGSGTVEITDSGRYAENLTLTASAGARISLRAADGRRPTLALTGSLTVQGGADAEVELNGLLILGHPVVVPASTSLARLSVRHCTVVPGATLAADGTPQTPGAVGVEVGRDACELVVERSITGSLVGRPRTRISLLDSVVDACDPGLPAIGSAGGASGALSVGSSTVVGTIAAHQLQVSDSLLLGDVQVTDRQSGCARFSYLPPGSRAPERYRCAPADPADVPRFTSLSFAAPGYTRLADSTPEPVRRGSEDESEMGVHRRLQEPQREADLLTRFDEYLRLGLRAGVIHES
ncbi:hypothetical protein [Blastococcus saxobsidens]|uniref:Uncharacterized protein n=1 Tax=Blastococcus saxobsidens (strain DD2) TaxID=1146883 RepID=H6RPG6_BLASD|nr:hypothetical protein [Blastococcus saxobsidens]CCG04025.1 conserved protein of unknown function [Blastococcus saxobsidens DD2]